MTKTPLSQYLRSIQPGKTGRAKGYSSNVVRVLANRIFGAGNYTVTKIDGLTFDITRFNQ